MSELEFPGLKRRELSNGITWQFYKHWGQSYLAGESRAEWEGDHSGGLQIINGMRMTSAPSVAQARVYESARGHISAVYSYPNGIGIEPDYFWELYSSSLMPDPERFSTEEDMERRVVEVLGQPAESEARDDE